ncbi:MAG: hypothetical protein AB1938_16200 [Myxococcota bacterium]
MLPELPPKKNAPLRVLPQTAKPAQRRTTIFVGTLSPSCPRNEFSMTVYDEDSDDPIRSQWYIDPETNYEPTPDRPVFTGNPIFGGTSVTREVTAPNAMLTFLASLKDGNEHIVEGWVTDSEFVQDAPPTQVFRPPRTLADGTEVMDTPYTDFNVWVVKVENCQ